MGDWEIWLFEIRCSQIVIRYSKKNKIANRKQRIANCQKETASIDCSKNKVKGILISQTQGTIPAN